LAAVKTLPPVFAAMASARARVRAAATAASLSKPNVSAICAAVAPRAPGWSNAKALDTLYGETKVLPGRRASSA